VGRDLGGVIDAVLAGIVVIDSDGRVEHINSAACQMLDTSAETALQQPLRDLFADGHPVPAMAESAIATGGTSSESELRIRRRFDRDLVIDVAASPLFDEAGPPNGAVLALRDRTLQKTLERLVADRESITAFGNIAAGIAHEVKNPLGGIRGAAELLISRADDPKTREIAGIVVREVERIASLVDDLMVFTKGDALKLEPTNIHKLLDDVLDLISLDPVSEKITLERHYDPSIPEILVDANRLAQVFLNLTRNGAQAMEETGGTLTVRTRTPLDQRLSDADSVPIPTLLVCVGDTGPGIGGDILHKLATPFFTTRANGTGLGLAVSRNWVSRHGGTMRIESTLGEGTTVHVALPLRRASE
jgi:two-component system nitrogen regulation sensor histidine kinase GlnL